MHLGNSHMVDFPHHQSPSTELDGITSTVSGSRNVLTPRNLLALNGRSRRRNNKLSGIRKQRNSPYGALKSLGKLLATNSRQIASSSSSPETVQWSRTNPDILNSTTPRPIYGPDDFSDDDLLLSNHPRLSLIVDSYDRDDDDLHPHQSFSIEDDNLTSHSVEVPRRAVSSTRHHDIFGSIRLSDWHRANGTSLRLSDLAFEAPLETSDHIVNEDVSINHGNSPIDGLTSRHSTPSTPRDSDFGLHVPLDLPEDGMTFAIGLEEPENTSPGHSLALPTHMEHLNIAISQGAQGAQLMSTPVTKHQVDSTSTPDNVSFISMSPDIVESFNNLSPYGSDVVQGGDHPQIHALLPDYELIATPEGNAPGNPSNTDVPPKITHSPKLSSHTYFRPPRHTLLPLTFIRRIALTCMRANGLNGPKLTPDIVDQLNDITNWFIQQVGDDLKAYASHAHRKFIDESDVHLLLKRQGMVSSNRTLFSLCQRHLPSELSRQIRREPFVGI